jgi:hypothetical protein
MSKLDHPTRKSTITTEDIPMPPLRRAAGEGTDLIAFSGPTRSAVEVDGRLYVLMTWTLPQWCRTPEDRRPPDAWRHGDLMVALVAS